MEVPGPGEEANNPYRNGRRWEAFCRGQEPKYIRRVGIGSQEEITKKDAVIFKGIIEEAT